MGIHKEIQALGFNLTELEKDFRSALEIELITILGRV